MTQSWWFGIVMFVGLVCLAGAEYGRFIWGWISTETLCRKWAPFRRQHFPRTGFKGIQKSSLQYYSTRTEINFKDQINTSYCGVVLFIILNTAYGVNIVFVSEVEGAAEAKIASSTISAEDAGVSLGLSGFSHTTWSPPPSPGLAEVLAALSQTARTWVWVCTLVIASQSTVIVKKWFHVTTSAPTYVCCPLGWLQVDVLAEGSSKPLLRLLYSESLNRKYRRCLTFTMPPARLSGSLRRTHLYQTAREMQVLTILSSLTWRHHSCTQSWSGIFNTLYSPSWQTDSISL